MPTYTYQCSDKHITEVFTRSMSDKVDTVKCEFCEKEAESIISTDGNFQVFGGGAYKTGPG